MMPLLLYPARYHRWPTGLARTDYGERRRAKELAKVPMFPDMVPSAETFAAIARDVNQEQERFLRAGSVANWRKVRAWRDQATEAQRAEFRWRWTWLPHKPEYALDLIQLVERDTAKLDSVSELSNPSILGGFVK